MNKTTISASISALGLCAVWPAIAATSLTDRIEFGDPASEAAQGVQGERTTIVKSDLGRTARQLLPLAPGDWRSGTLAFELN